MDQPEKLNGSCNGYADSSTSHVEQGAGVLRGHRSAALSSSLGLAGANGSPRMADTASGQSGNVPNSENLADPEGRTAAAAEAGGNDDDDNVDEGSDNTAGPSASGAGCEDEHTARVPPDNWNDLLNASLRKGANLVWGIKGLKVAPFLQSLAWTFCKTSPHSASPMCPPSNRPLFPET